jgi:hypothetical protein
MKLARLFLIIAVLLTANFSFTSSVHAVAEEGPACPCDEEECTAGKHLFLKLGTGFYKNYISSTSGGQSFGRPVFQGYGELTYMTPNFTVYIKTWGSKIIVPDGGKHGGDEWDQIIAGVAFPVWKFKIDVGYGYYDLHPQFRGKGDLHGLFGTISLPNKWVEPYLTVEYDIPTAKQTLGGGWYYRAGIFKCIKLRKNLSLNLDASFGGNDGAFGAKPDFVSFVRGTAALEWQPFVAYKNFTLVATGGYQKRVGHRTLEGGLASDATIASLEAKWRFDLLGR